MWLLEKNPNRFVHFDAGEYSLYASGTCQDCPLGHKCPTLATMSPQLCADGYYINALRQSSCSICEAGRSCVSKTNSTECGKGYYSPAGQMECFLCGSGNYR